jgi:MYND finger
MNDDGTAQPVRGSWVAELEDAKYALSIIAMDADGASASLAPLLEAHLRVCRAYGMLRQWERLNAAAKRGLIEFSSSIDLRSADPGVSRFRSSFREYRKRARAELAVDSMLTVRGVSQIFIRDLGSLIGTTVENRNGARTCGHAFRNFGAMLRHNVIVLGQPLGSMCCHGSPSSFIVNANLFQNAAVLGDVRCMEETVALGAAIDGQFYGASDYPESTGTPNSVALPPRASALIMACVALAMAEATGPAWVDARRRTPLKTPGQIDSIAECAMLMVRLGADPKRTLHLGRGPMSRTLRDLEGKSAFQIAAMSKRRALVALMLEHMQLTPEQRAEVVHCRCGSRLPWKMCHATGPGQPSHYMFDHSSRTDEPRTHYRVSPMARCPCRNSATTYFKCCWRDNRAPVYLDDHNGNLIHTALDTLSSSHFARHLQNVARDDPRKKGIYLEFIRGAGWARACIALFRESPSHFQALCLDAGPKSSMPSWDPIVYAGCLERLEARFLWKDVHWDLDRAVLLQRAALWNAALSKYCDDEGLGGDERDRVVDIHGANPCGPCTFAGCDAFEEEAREFRRCARCKLVAYCGRKCQRSDWAEHQRMCTDSSKVVVLPKQLFSRSN